MAIGLALEHPQMGCREPGLYFRWITAAAVTMQAEKFDWLMEDDAELQARVRRIVADMVNIYDVTLYALCSHASLLDCKT